MSRTRPCRTVPTVEPSSRAGDRRSAAPFPLISPNARLTLMAGEALLFALRAASDQSPTERGIRRAADVGDNGLRARHPLIGPVLHLMQWVVSNDLRLAALEWREFNPAQPRVPAGSPDGGQWTSGESSGDTPDAILVGDGRGLPINLLEEEAKGGHAIARHVGKPEQFLKARILGSRSNLPQLFSTGLRRAGSFRSLEAANKLVNSVIAANSDKIEAWLQDTGWTSSNRIAITVENNFFGGITGYEAFARNNRVQPIIQDTFAVDVILQRSRTSPRGFDVLTAWPLNHED